MFNESEMLGNSDLAPEDLIRNFGEFSSFEGKFSTSERSAWIKHDLKAAVTNVTVVDVSCCTGREPTGYMCNELGRCVRSTGNMITNFLFTLRMLFEMLGSWTVGSEWTFFTLRYSG